MTCLGVAVRSVEGGRLGAGAGARVCEAAGVAQGASGLGVGVQSQVVKLKKSVSKNLHVYSYFAMTK
jgi:hypothetical protein